MKTPPNRLTELSNEDMIRLQAEADELADLQAFLNRLPMSMQVEALSDDALTRLRALKTAPEQTLCGPSLLHWHNLSRTWHGITPLH